MTINDKYGSTHLGHEDYWLIPNKKAQLCPEQSVHLPLVTPWNLKDPADWNIVKHDEFDGVIADCFKSTSLHMSTEFVLPIYTGLRGSRDTEISVHGKGRWMGDLKILPVFSDPLFRVIEEGGSICKHA